jgi:hypothetical protein
MPKGVSAAAAALAVVVASVAPVGADASAGTNGRASARSPTVIYDLHGHRLAVLGGAGLYGGSDECWVQRVGRTIYAGITHNTVGGARAVSPRKWKVWDGKRLAGLIVWHSRNRWDLIRTSRLNRYGVDMGPLGPVGYTIGPDGPVAGTAFLLLGVCV